jgi:hemolysin activation/secretion protein
MSLVTTGVLLLAAAQAEPLPGASAPLILDQGRADRIQPAPPPLPLDEARPVRTDGLAQVDAAGSGAPIVGISFQGVEVPEPVADAARAYIGKPASKALLQQLARAMSDAYAKTDVALYTVAIPEQDLSTGTVRVLVAEGFVEDIVWPKEASPLIRAYGERLKAERPLTRRAMERYLSLMRDVPGAKIEVQLLRGRKAGGVVLSITPVRKRSDFSVGFDNRGTRDLGRGQFRGEAIGYGLLRDGDRTTLTLLAAEDFKAFRYVSLGHATPLGSDGLTMAMSGAYLQTRPRGSVIRGEAETASLTFSYPLIRGYKRNLSLSLGLDGVNSDAAAFGSVISSDRTRALRGAVGYQRIGPKSVLTAGLTLTRGLDILGARSLIGFAETGYSKVNGRFTWDRQIGKRIVGRLRASAQYSEDRLAGAERFAIGGAEAGRAFPQAIVTGDRGYAVLAELALRPKLPKPVEGSEIYAFVDRAALHVERRLTLAGGDFDLASAGAGVRVAIGRIGSIELEGARALDDPTPAYRDAWQVNIGWRLRIGKR